VTDVDKAVDADDGLDAVDPVDTAKNLEDWKWEGGDAQRPGTMADRMADRMAAETRPAAPGAKDGNPIWRFVTSDRGARWTSWLVILVVWQIAGQASERFPTPLGTVEHLVKEFQAPYHGPWSVWNNQLVQNIVISLWRALAGLTCVILIGVPVGWAMGRWWRVQAYFTDGVTIGLALPAYIWAMLAIMVFGFGMKAPIFTVVVSATPGLIVHVLQGTFAIPRELQDMTHVYGVPFQRQVRNLTLPSMAGQLVAGVRLAVLAGWGCVVLVEWFGSNGGVGYQARDWYLTANFNGLMAWALVMIVIIVFIDRVIISRIDRRVHRWRGAVGGFGGASRAGQQRGGGDAVPADSTRA
jgi:ABC-type nitrate/sulfonate/bicarbonate transport system permease component